MICSAKNRSGVPCQKHSLDGKTRCRLHGGLSLAGKDSPRYIHGRRSKAYIENTRRVRAELRLFEQLGKEYGWFVG